MPCAEFWKPEPDKRTGGANENEPTARPALGIAREIGLFSVPGCRFESGLIVGADLGWPL